MTKRPYITLAFAALLGLASCSDEFLEEKKNYDNVNKDIYNLASGINGRLNDIYAWSLPQVSDLTWQFPSCGNADAAGKSTEEYAGFSIFVDPDKPLVSSGTDNSVPDYFMGDKTNIQASVYGRIRNINDFIKNVSEGSAPQSVKDGALAQAYFLRAWCYYNLFKWYGGVPLVTEILEPVESSFTPRASAKATYEFILTDLRNAATMLKGKNLESADWGRITEGTALALKGRLMTLWCSPMFNRKDDTARWQACYEEMSADIDAINACGYGLYTANAGNNAMSFAAMFCQNGKNPEAVFVTNYNNIPGDLSDAASDIQKNNPWERSIRPGNTGGSGKGASQAIINLFPMKDGRVPQQAQGYATSPCVSTLLPASDVSYNENLPFVDRDPRFYRTFAFPGFRWAYDGDATPKSSNNPSNAGSYVLWNYVWYTTPKDASDPESGESFGADNLLKSKQGVYIRKKSDDKDVNSNPLYNYDATASKNAAPFFSAAQLIELRYAEVLLNMAEVATGAGHPDEALGYLKQIRERAGYTGDCGLTGAIGSDRATTFAAILYERQIEFAYEGKRFDDCRRWMLYDGGATQPEGAPQTWNLTGFGGNTCTYLGLRPLNGTRRENIVFRTQDKFGFGGTKNDGDPLLKAQLNGFIVSYTAPNVYTRKYSYENAQGQVQTGKEKDLFINLNDKFDKKDDSKDVLTKLQHLVQFYNENLTMKVNKGDARLTQGETKVDEYMLFLPRYYFLGLTSGAQSNNKGLPQTIGWTDYNEGGMGTFDPLAE